MEIKFLQMKRALRCVLLVLLLTVVGMTNAKAQTPYRQYADNGVLLDFHEIDNVDFRVFLLYNLSQDDRFILISNEESGQFSIVANDENDEEESAGFFDAFESFYQNAYVDFCLLSKTDLVDLMPLWKSAILPTDFVSVMMDVSLRNSRSDNNHCVNSQFFSPDEIVQFEAASTPQTANQLEGTTFDDGCIGFSYNPSWFHLRISTSGQVVIHLEGHDPNNSNTLRDIDFCMWGPFDDPTTPCVSQLTSNKIVDCSFSASCTEDAYLGYPENEHQHNVSHGTVNYHVPQTGEYYILMITNFSRQPCNITFSKRENFPILFADANVKALCVANWDTNDDGELNYDEAAAVTSLGNVFNNKSFITSFNELQYFTGLTSINDQAFYNCTNLTSIKIPNTVNSIGNFAFYFCNRLTSITIPNSLTSIESYAFYYCTGLRTITIPNSVTFIGAEAFRNCSGLTSVEIPNSVTSIGTNPFSECSNLEQIVVTSGNTYYDSRENCNAIIRTSTNALVTGCKNTVIPNSVTSISSYAFYYCSGLTSIEIPGSVTDIYSYAFYNCRNMTSMVCLAETPPTLGNYVFSYAPNTIPVYVPCGTIEAYQSANGWSGFTNIVGLCSGEVSVVVNPFYGGTVTGAGNYNGGDVCVLTAMPNQGYTFGNWTENGRVVSTESVYSFYAHPTTIVANFCTNVMMELSFTACDSYTWNGETYTESGDYEQTLTTAQGCDSIVILHLTINDVVYNDWYVEACYDSYTWNGQTYNTSGDYTQQFISAQGCDSIVTLHLNINQIVENYFTETVCDSYTWNGQTYNTSGNYTQQFTSVQGCDSIVTLHLTINYSDGREFTATGCDSYTWNGQTYNTSGNYTQQFTTMQGCDSIVTLHLTISDAIQTEFTVQACDSYTWNGVSYNTSGYYTQEFTSAQGCDSIVTLHLTVNHSETEDFNETACDAFTWHGTQYTESGDYTWNTTTAQGCDKTVTLHLTINNSEWEEYSDTVCDSYTWAFGNGQTYTESGDYVWNTTTAQGCDKNVTLHLTINNSEWEEYTVTASDSYTWHGTTYTQSGTYHYETTTAQGCSRTEILHLTIDGNHWTPVADGQYPFAMTLYGVISIDGVEQTNNQLELGVFCGNECRGTAMASEFFLTHRYLAEVNVYGDSGEQLTFKLYNHATHQELDLTPPAPITFTIDGYGNPINPYMLNFISSVNITATTAPEGAGTVTGTGEYTIGSTCTLTATANTGFQFLNWTLDGTVVSTSSNYSFTVTGAANYVAHFQYVQSRTLVSGWNWWSTYIEQNGSNGLEMLENSLGTSGIRIQGKNNSVDYFEYQGTGYWYGSLNTLTNEQMYMIRTSAACDAVIVGDAALPSNHPITINGGWNWIGYPYSQSVSVDAAMAGFTPEPNDVIKGRSSASMYLSYGGYQGWYGQLNILEPGQGYMYRSYSDATKTLRFQTGRGGETLANITSDNNVFVPNTANYADNMIVTAVIDMEGVELRSEDYELAAFAGNECRGSVKLMYVEPYDRYVALLMAYGEGGEELRFVLTDGEGTSWSNDRVTYTANGMVGTMTEPTMLHFGPMGTEDNLQKPIHIYPNPSIGIFNIEGEGLQKIEVIDIYGQVILSKEVKNANHKVDLSDKAAGAYLLRVVTVDGIVTHKLIKNN